MDVLGTAWGGLYVHHSGQLTDHKNEDDIKVFLDRMFNLLKRKSHLHWHTKYCELYIKEKVCPLGLRMKVFPTIRDPPLDPKKLWEHVLTKCSVELMTQLTSQYYADMAMQDDGIKHLNAQFPKIMDSPTFTDKWKDVREHLETLNKEIITKKQGKFAQDKLAF